MLAALAVHLQDSVKDGRIASLLLKDADMLSRLKTTATAALFAATVAAGATAG